MNMARIVTFGEAMIRLAPPHSQRIEQAHSFDLEIGGAELNTAVGLAQLGHDTFWVSVLPDNALGRLVRNRVRETGVKDTFISLVREGRCGLCFLEPGAEPRPAQVLYDRSGASFSLAPPETFEWPRIFKDANWFHMTGITPALSESSATNAAQSLVAARKAGVRISIDLNYRSKLWSAEKAGRVMAELISHIDLLIASPEDARNLFEINGDDFLHVSQQIAKQFHIPHVATIRREESGAWRGRVSGVAITEDHTFESPWIAYDGVDRIGVGDAFAGGLIDGILNQDIQAGVNTGTAMAALKHTIPGDLPLISRDDLQTILTGRTVGVRR
jgi:2-dehydro-3-deoxygluconokinase